MQIRSGGVNPVGLSVLVVDGLCMLGDSLTEVQGSEGSSGVNEQDSIGFR